MISKTGTTFTYTGSPTPSPKGILEKVTITRDMADGGYEEDTEDRIIVSKTNFPTGISFNTKLTIGGKMYTVKGVAEEDELAFTYKLYLK